MELIVGLIACGILVGVVVITAAIILGGPRYNNRVSDDRHQVAVNGSDLPALRYYTTSDTSPLAFRRYDCVGALKVSVVMVHGSATTGKSLHHLATALSKNGYDCVVPDMRGHGESGSLGQVQYIGQLEQDIVDLVEYLDLKVEPVLLGFSSGGGFALRFAGSKYQARFKSYMLIAPFISHNSLSNREGNGLVTVGLPRIIALVILNKLGIGVFNGLPVLKFPIPSSNNEKSTTDYSYSLSMNFRPELNYGENIKSVKNPLYVVGGDQDELFDTSQYGEIFSPLGQLFKLAVVPNTDHVGLINSQEGFSVILATLDRQLASS